MLKKSFSFLGLLTALLIGALLMFFVFKQSGHFFKPAHVGHTESNVLLEKIRNVYKVILVEGEFADILRHQDYFGIDLPGFRKNAIIKVKGKVSVGYDLDELQIIFDQNNNIVQISNLPNAEILAIDTEITYYDINNGIFNSFTPEELSRLNKVARQKIEDAAYQSNMLNRAEKQSSQMLDLITLLAKEGGWTVEYLMGPPPTGLIDQ